MPDTLFEPELNIKLKDCTVGQEIVCFLAVRKSGTGKTNNGLGQPFLSLTLSDGETDIDCKQWNYDGPVPAENTVIKVQATVDSYQGQPQLIIQRWRPAEEGECTQRFIPVCPNDIDEMTTQLLSYIKSITHEGLRAMVFGITGDILDELQSAPGAMTHHHNYIGGLLEHTVNVTDRAMQLAYGEEVNENLLAAGAILHDIGKIYEYDWSGCSIVMRDEGRLIGHICRGVTMIEDWHSRNEHCGVDRDTINLLLHMMVSHHGKLEWGSPIEPVTKEAVLLHIADTMDAQLWKIKKAESETEPGNWTQRIYGIGKEFFVPQGREG